MESIGTGSLFSDELLDVLPINYRFMTILETSSFKEHYSESRFSTSQRHNSKQYINAGFYKPLSNIVYQNLLEDEG